MKQTAYLCALMLVFAPAMAVQVEGNRFTLSPEEVTRCNAEGGCAVITRAQFGAAIDNAVKAAISTCGMRT